MIFRLAKSGANQVILVRQLRKVGCSRWPSNGRSYATTSTVRAAALDVSNINPKLRKIEYAVRGPLVQHAIKLGHQLKGGTSKPFKSIIGANIGDCQAMNQKPVSYIRQVLACAADKQLLQSAVYPDDVKQKVRELLADCGGSSVGSYSDACGLPIIRRHIAEYIEQRDQLPADPSNIFLTSGASQAVKILISLIEHSREHNKPPGVMIPIPQYPLYSATLSEFGFEQVDYFLDESADWSLSIDELERAYDQSSQRADIRALVVINPGNPTGSVLDETNIIEIIKFAQERRLMLIADEVYQHNIYDDEAEFHSFKKVMLKNTDCRVELASLMSASKGFMGECGLRGGYCELTNFSDDIRSILYTAISSHLCPSIIGQLVMDCVVAPPKAGEQSLELFDSEKRQVLADLKRKAALVAETLNSVEGVCTNRVAGAMYAFPNLTLPSRAIEEAKSLNVAPDYLYVLQFLENYGVCVVPGSGFGQKPGSYHFRTTILPPADIFEDMMHRFKQFHIQFLEKYS